MINIIFALLILGLSIELDLTNRKLNSIEMPPKGYHRVFFKDSIEIQEMIQYNNGVRATMDGKPFCYLVSKEIK